MRRVNLIPMAGEGKRFLDAGYSLPKPLIKLEGVPMVVRSAASLPSADCWIFICRSEHVKKYGIDNQLKKFFPNPEIITVNYLTEGQASTCLLAKDLLRRDDQLNVCACDNFMDYDINAFEKSIDNSDALIWTFRKNESVLKNPQMYGWVDVDKCGLVKKVSCKKPISDKPFDDHAIVGAFSFQKASTFIECVEKLIKKNRRINNEFYMDVALDECIKLGFVVKTLEVKKYICWGTPKDLEEYINLA